MSNLSLNHTISLFRKDFYTIKVIFNGDKKELGQNTNSIPTEYTYKCLKSIKLEVDDIVVVLTPDGFHKCVTVTEVHNIPKLDYDSRINYKWIVGKVNTSVYESILEQEEILKERIMELEIESKRQEYLKTIDEMNPLLSKELESWVIEDPAENQKDGSKVKN